MVAIAPAALLTGGLSLLTGGLGAASNAAAQRQARRENAALTKYENQTNLQNWEFANKNRDYNYNESLRIYKKSKDVYAQQLAYNNSAAARSYESENRKMNEVLQSLAFTKQDQFVKFLQEQGQLDSRETSGRSTGRMKNGLLSQYGRNNAILAENLVSAVAQNKIDLRNISLQKQGADLDAYSRLGLKPINPPAPPKPIEKPVAGGSSNPLLTIGNVFASALSAGYQASL
jgi:hypothetical protein